MAKLQKRSKSHSTSPRSSKSSALAPVVLPVVTKQPGSETQPWHHAPKHESHRSENAVRGGFQTHQRVVVPKSDWTTAQSPTSPTAKIEQPALTKAQKRPSPLRMSPEVSAVSEVVVAGPSELALNYPRDRCGASCQKCGRPRKPFSPDVPNDEMTRAPRANWSLPGPGTEIVPSASKETIEKASVAEAPQPQPTAVPSNDQHRKRRKYFSLPSKSKPSFKGPTELASDKGNTVEQRTRPVSAPSPTKSPFNGPAEMASPKPRPKAAVHVHFATDDQLGRFAGHIRGSDTKSYTSSQAPKSLIRGPASEAHRQHRDRAVSSQATNKPHGAPQIHPRALEAAQPTLRPNSAVLYEWPLVTTLVNQPNSNPRIRHQNFTHPPSRSSLSLSKRPSHRIVRPYSKTRVHAPIPPDRTSYYHQSLLQQSRKLSSSVDNSSNDFRDSMSIQVLDMLQGFPGGELAATAKTPIDNKPSPERPPPVRLQTYPPDPSNENSALDTDAEDDDFYGDVYSPSDYGTENDDDDDDDDDHPLPVTPPQSDFSLASYSISDDKKLSLRPPSALTQASFSIGDDQNLSQNINSVSAPSSAASSPSFATAKSPPSTVSTSLSHTHPLALTPGHSVRDSEGMIPISKLSFVDLPEVISSASGGVDEEIDPDWFAWGALPGSYGSAGMWSETSPVVSLGVDVVGSQDCRAELATAA